MESVAQRWEALYRKSAERIQEMEDRIRSLEKEVQDCKRQAELWKSMCVSILPPPRCIQLLFQLKSTAGPPQLKAQARQGSNGAHGEWWGFRE